MGVEGSWTVIDDPQRSADRVAVVWAPSCQVSAHPPGRWVHPPQPTEPLVVRRRVAVAPVAGGSWRRPGRGVDSAAPEAAPHPGPDETSALLHPDVHRLRRTPAAA